ncbi:MAG: hypothetical protein ACREGD_04325 [Candidatus Saccharimonadales bacterium]
MTHGEAESAQGLVLLLDLDRTVFDTNAFMHDVAAALGSGFGVDAASFSQQIPQFYVQGQGNLQHYDLFGHMASLGLATDQAKAHLLEALVGNNYVYDDVPPFLDFLAQTVQPAVKEIWTHGEQNCQELKYALAPELGGLALVTMLGSKAQNLNVRFPGQTVMIFDDKKIEGLQPSSRHVLVARDTDPLPEGAYRSFAEVQEHWDEIVDSLSEPHGLLHYPTGRRWRS